MGRSETTECKEHEGLMCSNRRVPLAEDSKGLGGTGASSKTIFQQIGESSNDRFLSSEMVRQSRGPFVIAILVAVRVGLGTKWVRATVYAKGDRTRACAA